MDSSGSRKTRRSGNKKPRHHKHWERAHARRKAQRYNKGKKAGR